MTSERVLDDVLQVLIESLAEKLPMSPLRTERTLSALRELQERRAVEPPRCICDDHQGTNIHCRLHGTDPYGSPDQLQPEPR
jgi:hypothetical protein